MESKLDITQAELDEYAKNLRQSVSPSSEEICELNQVLTDFGFPVVKAKYDAEQFCSNLVIDGYADAVYSTDIDSLVFGTPVLINEIVKDKFHLVYLDQVLKGLDLTFSQFVDLAILSGTDFNDNIPNIGIIKAYKLIKTYKCIENIDDKYDKSCLFYERVREIFKYYPSDNITLVFNTINMNKIPASFQTKISYIYNLQSKLNFTKINQRDTRVSPITALISLSN